jgi:hypothetical protein
MLKGEPSLGPKRIRPNGGCQNRAEKNKAEFEQGRNGMGQKGKRPKPVYECTGYLEAQLKNRFRLTQ